MTIPDYILSKTLFRILKHYIVIPDDALEITLNLKVDGLVTMTVTKYAEEKKLNTNTQT